MDRFQTASNIGPSFSYTIVGILVLQRRFIIGQGAQRVLYTLYLTAPYETVERVKRTPYLLTSSLKKRGDFKSVDGCASQ